MDTKLKTAMEQSDYMRTFQNQKRLLKEKFKKDCILYYNGGMFVVDILFVNSMRDPVSDVVIDANHTPIKIANMQDFFDNVSQTYYDATQTYYDAYVELCKYRDAKGLLT